MGQKAQRRMPQAERRPDYTLHLQPDPRRLRLFKEKKPSLQSASWQLKLVKFLFWEQLASACRARSCAFNQIR